MTWIQFYNSYSTMFDLLLLPCHDEMMTPLDIRLTSNLLIILVECNDLMVPVNHHVMKSFF